MIDEPLDPTERDQLASEYALGVLDGETLASVRALVRSDRQFGEAVLGWTGRLAPLLMEVEPRDPPARVWTDIDNRLADSASGSNVVQLRRRVHLWRSVSAGASALAASLAIVLVSQSPRQALAPVATGTPAPLVAMVGDDRKGTIIVASWDPGGRQLILGVAGDMPSDPSHAHELWVIPSDGTPHSLGTMPARKQMHMRLEDALSELMRQGATIAITVEPPGGSPTGDPTGPVVASGTLDRA